MKKQTVEVFHALMKKGWIDRSENVDVWRYYEDSDVQEELETMKDGLCFELIRSGDRIYLVPTQDNDLFLKNNVDFRKDISASNEVRTRDLYLMNYFSIYLLYMFYHGEGTDPRCREFISKEDAIKEFSDHCRACVKGAENAEELRASFGLGEKFTMLTDNLRAVLANDEDTLVIEVKQRGDETARRIVEAWVKEYADRR